MVDIKKIYIEVFKAIKSDTRLLDLLEIEYLNVDEQALLSQVRKQVIDTTNPDDLLTNYSVRICISEEPSTVVGNEETGYLRLDILITQDKNKIDRRVLSIAQRLIEILDTEELERVGKRQIPIGLYGLSRLRRMSKESSFSTGWDKYSVVFYYKFIA